MAKYRITGPAVFLLTTSRVFNVALVVEYDDPTAPGSDVLEQIRQATAAELRDMFWQQIDQDADPTSANEHYCDVTWADPEQVTITKLEPQDDAPPTETDGRNPGPASGLAGDRETTPEPGYAGPSPE